MLIDRIAQRYARSVYALAAEKGQTDAFLAEFKKIAELTQASPELRRFLGNPVITNERRLAVLRKVFEGHVEKVTLTLIEALARRNRAYALPYIAREYVTLYQKQHGITPVTVRTVAPLTPDQREAVVQRVSATIKAQVELTEKTDPEVIGGVILQVGDRRYDASLATQLRNLRKQFQDNPYIEKI